MQCSKSFYLYKNFYRLRDKPSAEQQARFDRGHRVGNLAQLLFPGGIDVSPKSPRGWPKSIETTSKLVVLKQPVIYEAAFARNGVMCAMDILALNNEGEYDAFEVKSSPGIRQIYVEDMALQYWVIREQKIKMGRAHLMLPKKPQDGFTDLTMDDMEIIDLTETIQNMQLDVEERIREASRTLELNSIPQITMGEHCNKPYPCDFQGTCLRHKQEEYV